MKALPAIIGCIVGIVVTMVACNVINSARDAQRSVQLLSDVHDPMRQCLNNIVETQDRGDVELAQQKVRLLQQRGSDCLKARGRTAFAEPCFGSAGASPSSRGYENSRVV